jgi:hypothetical protein
MASSVLNSDDGVISGTSGLKSSGGDDGSLAVQSNGTELAKFKTTELVINDGGANYDFRVEGDTNANLLFVDASADRIGINKSAPDTKLNIGFTGPDAVNTLRIEGSNGSSERYALDIQADGDNALAKILIGIGNGAPVERMRINSSGNLLLGKTAETLTTVGGELYCGSGVFTVSGGNVLFVNRLASDGDLVRFYQASTEEGTISVTGTTVSYNGGHLSRWAQLTTPKDDTPLFKGTVMSNLDEMNVYIAPTTYWTEEDELPVDEEGNPTVAVGDVKVETHEVQNEQLNKVKVSDVEGDANVAGVFVNWTYDEAHQVDEINMAMTGDMIIRIAQGVTVQRGDLLMSAGDGTAKPQGDDIVRSKTIAKVTSTHVTCTYDDGSYCVPCVLMAC